MKDLFPGTNSDRSKAGPPILVYAHVASGTTKILEMGAAEQPHTLMCYTRALRPAVNKIHNRQEEYHDLYLFVREFNASLGLSQRNSPLHKIFYGLIDEISGANRVILCWLVSI